MFVPGIEVTCCTNMRSFRVEGDATVKSDPFETNSLRPDSWQLLQRTVKYIWKDIEWMQQRSENCSVHEPISIYEVHLAPGKERPGFVLLYIYSIYHELLLHELGRYVQDNAFHSRSADASKPTPFDGSWGYQGERLFCTSLADLALLTISAISCRSFVPSWNRRHPSTGYPDIFP